MSIGRNSTAVSDASFGSVSLCGPLPHGSPVVMFFDLRHPGFWDFNSFVSFDVVRVTPHVNCLFHPACVEMGITINGIYFAPERAVSGVVGGVLRRKSTS